MLDNRPPPPPPPKKKKKKKKKTLWKLFTPRQFLDPRLVKKRKIKELVTWMILEEGLNSNKHLSPLPLSIHQRNAIQMAFRWCTGGKPRNYHEIVLT